MESRWIQRKGDWDQLCCIKDSNAVTHLLNSTIVMLHIITPFFFPYDLNNLSDLLVAIRHGFRITQNKFSVLPCPRCDFSLICWTGYRGFHYSHKISSEDSWRYIYIERERALHVFKTILTFRKIQKNWGQRLLSCSGEMSKVSSYNWLSQSQLFSSPKAGLISDLAAFLSSIKVNYVNWRSIYLGLNWTSCELWI